MENPSLFLHVYLPFVLYLAFENVTLSLMYSWMCWAASVAQHPSSTKHSAPYGWDLPNPQHSTTRGCSGTSCSHPFLRHSTSCRQYLETTPSTISGVHLSAMFKLSTHATWKRWWFCITLPPRLKALLLIAVAQLGTATRTRSQRGWIEPRECLELTGYNIGPWTDFKSSAQTHRLYYLHSLL